MGWHEHDPFLDVWDSVVLCITRTFDKLASLCLDLTCGGPDCQDNRDYQSTKNNSLLERQDWSNVLQCYCLGNTRTATVADTIISENSNFAGTDLLRILILWSLTLLYELYYYRCHNNWRLFANGELTLKTRLHIPAGILRIPVFSVPIAFFSQESQFSFHSNLVYRKKKEQKPSQ